MWALLKFLLSSLLVFMAGLAAYVSITEGQFAGFSGAAVFLFLAALPWVSLDARSRPLALAGVVFSLGLGFGSVLRYAGEIDFPRPCVSRGWTFCQLENGLYAVGGRGLLLAVFVCLGIALLALSLYGVFRYPSRPAMLKPVGRRNLPGA